MAVVDDNRVTGVGMGSIYYPCSDPNRELAVTTFPGALVQGCGHRALLLPKM
jgi:hypothetical protein